MLAGSNVVPERLVWHAAELIAKLDHDVPQCMTLPQHLVDFHRVAEVVNAVTAPAFICHFRILSNKYEKRNKIA
jgi:hypothetical protein